MTNNKKQIIEIILASLSAVLIAGFIRIFFFDTYIVTNKSMEPTFFEGDQILLLKKNFIFNRVKNFDVIVFNYNDTNLVKRVIGIEGDKVEIRNGGLYLNDELIEHKYYIFSNEDNGLYILGNNQYFVLGDNIKVSEDSRYFGLIDEEDIKGQVILIFSPKKRFQLFNNIFHHNENNISE
ncbi:signal peptidase I [Brachyspira hyodysenteriae]|uniref:signal peptidase I n=1 Tax=Brachyspira hyodysenteriae TaxID=159 RepID=UPI00063D9DCF|nr:signal peptidase I [Brachyspira hyodysenteriae]KLI14280.1 signal peptidase I [Brachyspira hyodysenteriae]KLI17087.1 signal peptidase I [Brachyspira hyodysenteriae]KLI33335.1 signal peptidase I [Brachyspira hyodysenteriae]KLI35758.1 signal peptidase I [Brachyspira hyodysenteriae]KLI36686.1 signal peptidase I [Brachyspira hyodysenteriae]